MHAGRANPSQEGDNFQNLNLQEVLKVNGGQLQEHCKIAIEKASQWSDYDPG